MSVTVVGSVALDTVETPMGKNIEGLGGAATFFSLAASNYTPVHLVGVVGEDFPEQHVTALADKGVILDGLERQSGKTFRWSGRYHADMNNRDTLDTQLNVFETFRPQIPEAYRAPDVLFLGNIHPELQLDVLQKVTRPGLVACDTMNFWINGQREALWKVLEKVDVLIINDGEARALGQDSNLVKVAKLVLSRGPKHLIVKRGEYGVLMFNEKHVFGAPAFPLEDVRDPTGAGDTFAGGFLGYLAATGNYSPEAMKQAIIFGSVMASFTVEAFSLDRLRILDYKEIQARFAEFKRLTHFEDI